MSRGWLSQKIDANVGTCGYCGGLFKVKPEQGDRVVKHGYQRPRWGFLVGGCMATGSLALEVSDEGLVLLWQHAMRWLANVQADKARLDAGLVVKIVGGSYGEREGVERPRAYGRTDDRPRVCTPEHKDWAQALKVYRAQVERDLVLAERDAREITLRLAAWQPKPDAIRRTPAPHSPEARKALEAEAKAALKAERQAALVTYKAAHAALQAHDESGCATCRRAWSLTSAERCEEGKALRVQIDVETALCQRLGAL